MYIGGPAFGARKAVGNSLEDIEKAVCYAHRFYCRVFVTLNTILYDEELPGGRTIDSQPVPDRCGCYYRAGPGHIEVGLATDSVHASTQSIIMIWSVSSFSIGWDPTYRVGAGNCHWNNYGRFAGK